MKYEKGDIEQQKTTTSIGLTLVSNVDRNKVEQFHKSLNETFNCPTQHLFRQVISFVTKKKISSIEELNESLNVLKSNKDFMKHFETFELTTRKKSTETLIKEVKNSNMSKEEKLKALLALVE